MLGIETSEISYKYHHFPPAVIRHAVWLYCRFTLSLRDAEDLLAERGIEVSYETIRRWAAVQVTGADAVISFHPRRLPDSDLCDNALIRFHRLPPDPALPGRNLAPTPADLRSQPQLF